MGKIQASLAAVSTEFQPVEPGLYTLEIESVEEVEKDGKLNAYRVKNKVLTPGDMEGRTVSDFINIITKKGELNEIGLANLKRYFEVTHGKDEVATWEDDDYDTDLLQGKQFQAQVAIESYTPEGGEPRQNNRIKRMEPVA